MYGTLLLDVGFVGAEAFDFDEPPSTDLYARWCDRDSP